MPTYAPIRTVLLGGSFNPAHGGHRRITLGALTALGCNEAWWLVSPGNPLKPAIGMAALPARIAGARRESRRAPIRVTAIERELRTRFTADTLIALSRRYPKRQFIWLMGADNLAQFHRWKAWRKLSRTMPIAVVARPGYDSDAFASPAMAWLGRFRRSVASLRTRAAWRAPALVLLRFDPDPRSASALRDLDSEWVSRLAGNWAGGTWRDGVTHRALPKSVR